MRLQHYVVKDLLGIDKQNSTTTIKERGFYFYLFFYVLNLGALASTVHRGNKVLSVRVAGGPTWLEVWR